LFAGSPKSSWITNFAVGLFDQQLVGSIFFLMVTTMNTEVKDKHDGKPSTFHIIVNGRPREVTGERITYHQVVALAFPHDLGQEQVLYSVHYTGPHMPDGTLAEGQSVKLHDGVKFDVTKTNRS